MAPLGEQGSDLICDPTCMCLAHATMLYHVTLWDLAKGFTVTVSELLAVFTDMMYHLSLQGLAKASVEFEIVIFEGVGTLLFMFYEILQIRKGLLNSGSHLVK